MKIGKIQSNIIAEAVFIPPASPASKKTWGVLTVYNDGIYNFIRIPQMWEEAREKGMIEDIFKLSDGKLWGVMGALANYTRDTVDYYIVATSNEAVSGDMDTNQGGKSTWNFQK